jgi:hypothetical protein
MTWSGQAAKHDNDADHGETYEGSDGASVAFEVAGEAAVAANPSEGSLDDPALGQDDELVQFGALDDLHDPTARPHGGLHHPRSLITSVGEDALDEGKEAACASIKHKPRPIAVLQVGGMDDDAQEEAERIDEDVPPAPRDLLARIETLRVKRGAPF